MAASAKPPNFATSGWIEAQQRSTSALNTTASGLGTGMPGMNLMPSIGGGPDVSRSPDMSSALDDSGSNSNREQRKIADSGDSVNSHRSSTNSPLPSSTSAPSKGMSRPPGLGFSASSAIDGGSDLYSMGRQSSPFHGDGPAMSSEYSSRFGRDDSADLPPGFGNLGNLDADDEGGHDGLLGLQALRDRTQSSSGPSNITPYSSSPPVRGQVGSHMEDPRSAGIDQRRPRTVSRDGGRPPSTSRPPLSGSGGLNPDASNFSHGVISRPDSRYAQYGGDSNEPAFGLSRRRSISTDTGREFNHGPYAGNFGHSERNNSMEHLSQKFSSLTSINSQPDQRLQTQQHYQSAQVSRPPAFQKHQRSMSQPGPMGGQGAPDHQLEDMQHHRGNDYGVGMGSQRYSPSMENEYLQHSDRYGSHQYQQRRGQPGTISHGMMHNTFEGAPVHAQRRSSLQGLSSDFDAPPVHMQRRASLQTSSSSSMYSQSRPMQRRESLDFVPGHSRFSDNSPIVASSDEMRMFSGSENERFGYQRHERMVTPAHSPLHAAYGSHSRHPSDVGSSTMSSSPMSLGSSGVRGAHTQAHDVYNQNRRGSHHRITSSDEEFSQGLLGEHIDVPTEDSHYMMNEGMHPHSQMRPAHGHGSTMEHPPHYGMDAPHHLPTAGAAMPMPKAVYNVKFKRTQRSFALGPRLNRDLKVGTYVKVEADRGEDLGIVVGKLPPEKFSRPSYRNEMGMMPPPGGMPPTGGADLKRIIRLATHDEVSLLGIKREEEEELLKVCRTKCRQRGLPMHVVDAEYQFDRHKLTFFFEAEGRIDFRELVRDLFSIYKTRIWMQQLDKNTSATCPTAAATPQPLVMDYGTPIIAPESEFSEFAALNASSGEAVPEND